MDLDLPTLAKPVAALGALLLLVGAERRWPASRWGRGSWRHDLRNLSLGALNGLIGVALAAWVLPASGRADAGALSVLGPRSPAWWLVGLLLLDLWTFTWHWLHHALPLLWRVHRVHHTDTLDQPPAGCSSSQPSRPPSRIAVGMAARERQA